MALLAIGMAALPPALRGQENWSWTLPLKIYQNLDFSERASVDRARDAYRRAEEAERRNVPVNELIPYYRAAAAEWKKFQLQYEMTASATISAYVLFMQGLSLQGARDRNAAIKAYTDLLDYFLDERWISTAALFQIGQAHLDNGDERRAVNTFLSLVEEPDHLKHPLAARALNRLGRIRWRAKKSDEAMDFWRRGITEHFKAVARSDYNELRDLYAQALSVTGNWRDYETLLFEEIPEEAFQKRAEAVQHAVGWLRNRMYHFWPGWYYNVYFPEKEREAKRAEWRKQLAAWYDSRRSLFASAERQWDHAVLGFRLWREYRNEEAVKRVSDVTRVLRALKLDDDGKAKAAREFAIVLCDCQMFDEARTLLDFVKDFTANRWLTYEIENRANNLPAAQLALEELVNSQDPAVSLNAKKRLAWFHKERTRQYDKAIALYLDISQPPGTLWDLQTCYRRAGKKLEAYTVLTELASIFPQEAARATWVQAQYREQDGEKEKAVALYRRLLSQPEWKKTWESSQAHQALERLGIATGGAVINEVR
jgi:tetratricopeptide (TPR) repeat protein